MHTVAVLAFDGVVPFDLAIPCEVFERARTAGGRPAYRVLVCSASSRVACAAFGLDVPHRLDVLATADTVVVPGVDDVTLPVAPEVVVALRAAAARGTRLASICSGAFVLAAAGLLDGRRATTHWLAADALARRYPAVEVDPTVLYVDDGQVLTSAGAAAGLDLCLHLVRRDLGGAAAADAARLSVMPLERAGGQAQFIRHAPGPPASTLEPLLRWIDAHLADPLTLPGLARRAAMSTRTFVRRFREQTGTTPARYLARVRLARAQELLETTTLSMDEVAAAAGYGSAATLRAVVRAGIGTTPTAYRRVFRAGVG